jgi:hypothetical protein
MDSVMEVAGWLSIGPIFLAIVVLATISWVKNRRSEVRKHGEDAGGSSIPAEDSTPGYWE